MVVVKVTCLPRVLSNDLVIKERRIAPGATYQHRLFSHQRHARPGNSGEVRNGYIFILLLHQSFVMNLSSKMNINLKGSGSMRYAH